MPTPDVTNATRPAAATTRATTSPAVAVGEAFPAFRMTRVGGKLVTDETLLGKPAVIVFGSWSSPSTRDQLPRLADVATRYGSRVHWLVVYTRELFPTSADRAAGPERNRDDEIVAPAATSDAERLAAARRLVDGLKLKLDVAPDAIDGRLARAVDAPPNGAFVLDARGTIVAKLDWAEPFSIKRHLDRLLATR